MRISQLMEPHNAAPGPRKGPRHPYSYRSARRLAAKLLYRRAKRAGNPHPTESK